MVLPIPPLLIAVAAFVVPAAKYGTQLIKPFLESKFPSTEPNDSDPKHTQEVHDSAIRLLSLVMGAMLEFVMAYSMAPLLKVVLFLDPPTFFLTVIVGAAAGMGAILDFHTFDSLRGK